MGLNDLIGIEKEKEIATNRGSHILRKLIEVKYEIIKEYCQINKNSIFHITHFHNNLTSELNSRFLKNTEYNAEDLMNLILSIDNHEFKKNDMSFLIGSITSSLLELLTRRNEEAGNNEVLFFNGHGKEIDHLFQYCSYCKDIVVENFKGNNICTNLGINGKARNVVLKDIEGDYCGYKMGSRGGNVNNAVLINCSGKFNFTSIGEKGSVGTVFAIKNYGFGIAYKKADQKGNIGLFYYQDNKQDDLLDGGIEAFSGDLDLMAVVNTDITQRLAKNLLSNAMPKNTVLINCKDIFYKELNNKIPPMDYLRTPSSEFYPKRHIIEDIAHSFEGIENKTAKEVYDLTANASRLFLGGR